MTYEYDKFVAIVDLLFLSNIMVSQIQNYSGKFRTSPTGTEEGITWFIAVGELSM